MKSLLLIPLLVCIFSCARGNRTANGDSLRKDTYSSCMSIEEATKALTVPGAAAPFTIQTGPSPELPKPFQAPYTPVKPVKLFDNFYFVGTTAVGSFIADSKDGLVMFDTGCGDTDAAIMVAEMKELGLNPASIKLIVISHEHFDHYGGVQYLKKNVCPDAKVAMSLVGWNLLQTVPLEGPYIGTRLEKVDIYLTDGMCIKTGSVSFQVIATPGHSPGCVSFIIPVTDHGIPHMIGLMGGSAVFPTQVETLLYKSSIEYFKAFTDKAGCDIGLYFHSQEKDFEVLGTRKQGEINPLILGVEKFNTVYLKSFRDRYQAMLNSGKLNPN